MVGFAGMRQMLTILLAGQTSAHMAIHPSMMPNLRGLLSLLLAGHFQAGSYYGRRHLVRSAAGRSGNHATPAAARAGFCRPDLFCHPRQLSFEPARSRAAASAHPDGHARQDVVRRERLEGYGRRSSSYSVRRLTWQLWAHSKSRCLRSSSAGCGSEWSAAQLSPHARLSLQSSSAVWLSTALRVQRAPTPRPAHFEGIDRPAVWKPPPKFVLQQRWHSS